MKNKIMRRWLKSSLFLSFLLFEYHLVTGQNLPRSPYGLPYISTLAWYQKSLIGHPEKQLVSLSKIPGIVLDLRYATANNFMQKKLYPGNINTTFLRNRAYRSLDSVATDLAKRGIILVIFDAYRPYNVTVSLWNQVKDERYAANPAKGSAHNRGLAVDLTLADAKTHKLLIMPTGFDNFTDSAHQDFNLPDSKRPGSPAYNRELLRKTMEKYGFASLQSEWWHFSWPDNDNFEVLDLSFDQIVSSLTQ